MGDPEIVNVLGSSGEIVGSMRRTEAEKQHYMMETALIVVFAPSGHVWIQQRALTKKSYPGRWDVTAGGVVQSGEHPDETARRELLEEAGLEAELLHLEIFPNIFKDEDGETCRFLANLYICIIDSVPQPTDGEVIGFRLMEPEALRAHAVEHPDKYVPSFLAELDKALIGYRSLVERQRNGTKHKLAA